MTDKYIATSNEDGDEYPGIASGDTADAAYVDWVDKWSLVDMQTLNSFEVEVFIFASGELIETRKWEKEYPDVPKFWVGVSGQEEDTYGGTGDTVEQAQADYVERFAESDADERESDSLNLDVCVCISPKDSPFDPDELDPDWKYFVGDKIHGRIWRRP